MLKNEITCSAAAGRYVAFGANLTARRIPDVRRQVTLPPRQERRPMVVKKLLVAVFVACGMGGSFVRAEDGAAPPRPTPSKIVNGALQRIATLVEPPAGEPARTFTATLRITKAEGLPREATGASVEVAVQ